MPPTTVEQTASLKPQQRDWLKKMAAALQVKLDGPAPQARGTGNVAPATATLTAAKSPPLVRPLAPPVQEKTPAPKSPEQVASLPGLFDPPGLEPAAILEPVERRVERGEREPEAAAGPLFDQFRDLVPVVAVVFHDREDHDFGAAFFGLVERPSAGHALHPYMKDSYIYHPWTGPRVNWLTNVRLHPRAEVG